MVSGRTIRACQQGVPVREFLTGSYGISFQEGFWVESIKVGRFLLRRDTYYEGDSP